MYNIIAELVLIASVTYGLSKLFPEEYKNINNKLLFFIDFCKFVCKSENNPLLLDYYDYFSQEDINTENTTTEKYKKDVEKEKIIEEKFEDKYLKKFKTFSNEFYFNEMELEEENKAYEKIKLQMQKDRQDAINEKVGKLNKINELEDKGGITKDTDKMFTENINDFGIQQILDYFDLKDDYEEDGDYINFEELYQCLIKEKNLLVVELKELEEKGLLNDEVKELARKTIVDKKLDKFINNYVLENTPIGNVYMRYNNSTGSFEYFSNNTIPYKYLETIGRKYVITYWCKPIFVDVEEELKKSEIKFSNDMKKKEEDDKKHGEMKNNPRNIMAKMKSYNKDTKNHTAIQPMKNRTSSNVLPPQIKSTIKNVNVNETSEKQLLKEKANRYTWKGRLSDFCPLKQIDKKVVNKSLNLTYDDFKRIQKEKQNKK